MIDWFTQTDMSSLKLMSIESVMPFSRLIPCRPLLLLPPIPPSIRVFSNESTLHTRWPKYWSFSFSLSPSNEHLGLISFRMDWLDLFAVQGTLKSLLISTDYAIKNTVFQVFFFSHFHLSNIRIIFNQYRSNSNHDLTALVLRESIPR